MRFPSRYRYRATADSEGIVFLWSRRTIFEQPPLVYATVGVSHVLLGVSGLLLMCSTYHNYATLILMVAVIALLGVLLYIIIERSLEPPEYNPLYLDEWGRREIYQHRAELNFSWGKLYDACLHAGWVSQDTRENSALLEEVWLGFRARATARDRSLQAEKQVRLYEKLGARSFS